VGTYCDVMDRDRFVDWGVVGPLDVASGLLQGLCGGAQVNHEDRPVRWLVMVQ